MLNILIISTAKYLLFLSAAIAIVYFFSQSKQRQKDLFVFAAILLPLSYILAKIFSYFYFDPRPFVIGHFAPLIPHAADNGFPSDHTLLAAAIAFAIFHFNKKMGLFLLLLAVLVGIARIAAGVHHPADIFGSITIAGLAYLPVSFFKLASWRNLKEKI